jgi:lysosomal Pro-X carboxypeptidase
MPMCNDGKQDMFEPQDWDLAAYSDDCFRRFGVRPKPYAAEVMYGGRDIMAASNIVFRYAIIALFIKVI